MCLGQRYNVRHHLVGSMSMNKTEETVELEDFWVEVLGDDDELFDELEADDVGFDWDEYDYQVYAGLIPSIEGE